DVLEALDFPELSGGVEVVAFDRQHVPLINPRHDLRVVPRVVDHLLDLPRVLAVLLLGAADRVLVVQPNEAHVGIGEVRAEDRLIPAGGYERAPPAHRRPGTRRGPGTPR